MTKIEKDKKIVWLMVEIYCRHHLHAKTMPEEYRHLIDYACRRLDHCRFGADKKACMKCPIHCYAPKERELIRKVMRWSGPRMIFYAPKATLMHMLGR